MRPINFDACIQDSLPLQQTTEPMLSAGVRPRQARTRSVKFGTGRPSQPGACLQIEAVPSERPASRMSTITTGTPFAIVMAPITSHRQRVAR
jgi:hypothetical protein